jgi:hypothetical protein
MSERTLTLTWCSFGSQGEYNFPENVRFVESRMVFEEHKKMLFNENILNNDQIWDDFFETYLVPFGFDFIKKLAIIEKYSNTARKYVSFGFFEKTIEITFQESENELNDFIEIINDLYEIIFEDIYEILAFFDLEFNYSMTKLKDKSKYEIDLTKRFESKEKVFYNIFDPIRNYLLTHFKYFDLSRDDFILGEINIFEI